MSFETSWEQRTHESQFGEKEEMSNSGTGENAGTPEETGLTPTQQAEVGDKNADKDQKKPLSSPEDFRKNFHSKLALLQAKANQNPEMLAAVEIPTHADAEKDKLNDAMGLVV